MGGGYKDREKGSESKFAHDEEMRFKVMNRRNKLLGLWAAAEMGNSGADAETYAKAVVAADFEEAGDNDVFRKVSGDLDAAKYSDGGIRTKMDELLAVAADQVEKDAK